MGTQISSDGYGSIGPNKAGGDWQTWPKGTPSHFEGRVIFSFEDGIVVEYYIPQNKYKDRKDLLTNYYLILTYQANFLVYCYLFWL